MSVTERLSLPLLQAGQSLREQTLNEALRRIDICLVPSVEGAPLDTPPSSPAMGGVYLVGGSPTGDWAGRAHQLAGFGSGGWRFVVPPIGMRVSDIANDKNWQFDGTGWSDLTQSPIADPTGGSVVDVEARNSLAAILAAMRNAGLIAG